MNITANAITNYFRVKDPGEFINEITGLRHGIRVSLHPASNAVRLDASGTDTGLWPHTRYDEDADEDVPIPWEDIFHRHLEDDQCVVIVESSNEGLRSLYAGATLFMRGKEAVTISLADLISKQISEWGLELPPHLMFEQPPKPTPNGK
jgi:hypothetical protein